VGWGGRGGGGGGGEEEIETVHNPEAIQTASSLWMDKVAVLWRDPTAHRPQDVKGLVPSR